MQRSAAAALAAVVLCAGLTVSARGEAVTLGKDNFEKEVVASGKNAFIKFLAPWCGHCKKMKPDWDKLGAAYTGSKTILIGDVDCTTADGKPTCSKYGVRGYPTIKYFTAETPSDGEAYKGGRDFSALSTFVKDKLSPCVVDTLENCNEEEKKFIEEAKGWDAAKIKSTKTEYDDTVAKNRATLKAAESELADTKKRTEAENKALSQKVRILGEKAKAKEEL